MLLNHWIHPVPSSRLDLLATTRFHGPSKPVGALGRLIGNLISRLIGNLVRPFFTRRFLQFATVGASGVVVNLAFLTLFKTLGVHINAASALAIELSLLSNFFINYAWTFRDRRAEAGGILRQAWRFHLVCLVGAGVQFACFVACNVMWLHALFDPQVVAAYHAGQDSWLARWLWHPLWNPPSVGNWVYLSQILGIGLGTAWNYLLNFYWTWGQGRPGASGGQDSPDGLDSPDG